MNRRTLIKLTGMVAAAQVLPGVASNRSFDIAPIPTGARLTIHEPGTYRISGVVRLDAPSVEIRGISNTQTVSWAAMTSARRPQSSFMSFERFEQAGMSPNILVRGGRLESLTAVRVDDQLG